MVHFRRLLCLPTTGITSPVFPWICWSLWMARNKLIFENKTAQPLEVATKGLSSALEWVQAQISFKPPSKGTLPSTSGQRQDSRLQLIPSCFVDAAWKASSNQAGIAWLFTKDRSIAPTAGSLIIKDVSSPLMAESLALRKDSQIKEIYGILQDIKNLSSLI
ncbi:hypothetical protein DY000_02057340 [Brassica cretica]|uniref:RNase H type-1 domain-containing protein n=1 Tax=Brassica cretica TaxID=69181 RepID=A0ABQ7A7S8_BRACR|nr:hypothetical protein DY000_02057340 [Brassica cretica]